MPTLTVFTPAYNRAYSLPRCYESLCRQTSRDFVWLVVDDGSTDDTAELVRDWQSRANGFEIRYTYKENGGMHTAHNTAYELIDTELNTCIDSDDCMPDDAVEKIVTFWKQNGSDRYAGLVGLDATLDGEVIGKDFPAGLTETTINGYYQRGGSGDKKLVYRTEIINRYPPYPVFPGEKYVSLGYKYLLCDQDYPLLVLNETLCLVEYQPDGSSNNMYRQYLNNPQGFAFIRKVHMQYPESLKRRFVTCIHYVSSSMLMKNRHFIRESPKKLLTVLAVPFGAVLTWLIRRKTR